MKLHSMELHNVEMKCFISKHPFGIVKDDLTVRNAFIQNSSNSMFR